MLSIGLRTLSLEEAAFDSFDLLDYLFVWRINHQLVIWYGIMDTLHQRYLPALFIN
jgi:hypothetical protein